MRLPKVLVSLGRTMCVVVAKVLPAGVKSWAIAGAKLCPAPSNFATGVLRFARAKSATNENAL